MSMFSFHPTKLFHSCEGGLLVFKDVTLQQKLSQLRNFAITSETECVDIGSNAKMNELQALMGLSCLKVIDTLIAHRAAVHQTYREAFADCPAVSFPNPATFAADFSPNYAYCPILFKDLASRERVYTEMKKLNVFTRRYFYPLLTDFAPYIYGKNSCHTADEIASRVLTLPTYYGLDLDAVREIAAAIKEMMK